MIRGTTPVIILHLSQAIDFTVLYVTFNQDDDKVLEKTLTDVTVDGAEIVIPLSQEETLSFDSKRDVRIQLRGKAGDTAYASKIVRISVSDILKDGEI